MGAAFPGEPSRPAVRSSGMLSSRLSQQISESAAAASNSTQQREPTMADKSHSLQASTGVDRFSAESLGKLEQSLPQDVPQTRNTASRRMRWLIGNSEDPSELTTQLSGRRTPSVVSAARRMCCDDHTNA